MKPVNQLRNFQRSYFYHTLLLLLLAVGLSGCQFPKPNTIPYPTIPPTQTPTPDTAKKLPTPDWLPTPPDAPLEQEPLSNYFADYETLTGSAQIIESPALTTPQEAALAVVRIRGCDESGNCVDTNQGSGAIIHPQGIILTAWHVTVLDPKKRALPDFYNHFLIEITDDISQAPQPRYYARWIAYNAVDDLALLRIVGAYGEPSEEWTQPTIDLPWLPISNAARPAQPDLWVVGYPPRVNTVDSRSYRYSGLDGSRIRIPDEIPKGFSGGPTLVQEGGSYEIVGVVSSRVQDNAFIRQVQQLENLAWLPQEQMWAEDVEIVATTEAGQPQLQLTVHTLGYRATELDLRPAFLLVADNQERKAQLRLQSANFVNIQQIRIPLDPQSQLFDQPLFVSIFRLDEGEVWRVEEWVQPPAIQPTATPSPTPTAVATPIPTATRPPDIPAPTLTAAAFGTRVAIALATAEAAQPTATLTPTPNLEQTATADTQEIALAAAATLTAKAPTTMPTPTLNLEQTVTAQSSQPVSIPNLFLSPFKQTYCNTGLGSESTVELENDLLIQAKNAAVNELFDEQITSAMEMGTCNVSRNDFVAPLAKFVRISEAEYYNGEEFAEVCVSFSAYIEERDKMKFAPEEIFAEACN